MDTSGAMEGASIVMLGGNVGIGSTAPKGISLDVIGDFRTTIRAQFATTSGNVGLEQHLRSGNSTFRVELKQGLGQLQ